MGADQMLEITAHAHHTEVKVLRSCTIRWSVDGSTWHDMGDFTPGCVLRDYNAPQSNPRNYEAKVDEHDRLIYYHRAAALAFADMMEPWFPSRRNSDRR